MKTGTERGIKEKKKKCTKEVYKRKRKNRTEDRKKGREEIRMLCI